MSMRGLLRTAFLPSGSGFAAAFSLLILWPTAACPADPAARNLSELSLEDLGKVEVTSVSRRAERLLDAPSSVFVISGDDIRRAGATTLPEALRLAPNLYVGRTNASSYSISARGFNSSGNKLLVLIDGRSVYTPLFSGVFWDEQDVVLEDVERIEVISGPGATLWGSNAVNGVINVITRSAADTQGKLASGGLGNLESGLVYRHGGKLGAQGAFRVYAKYQTFDAARRADGTGLADSWYRKHAGFRADWGTAGEGFTLQGDAYLGEAESTASGRPSISGANLLARWNRQLAGGSSLHVQTYYARSERSAPASGFSEDLDTLDVELQHAVPFGTQHRLLWGAGYRNARDHVTNGPLLAFLPADVSLNWGNLFAQGEFRVSPAGELTVGGKLESNPYTGVEFLPSARFAWKPAERQLVWGSASRAVRAPSRLDRELFIPGTPPFTLLRGGPNFESEISNVFEIGYRSQPSRALLWSATAFVHRHDKLRSITPLPIVIENKVAGSTRGLEGWAAYEVARDWHLSGGFLLMQHRLRLSGAGADPASVAALGNDPKYQWRLQSSHTLGERQKVDLVVRRVGRLPNPVVPAYTAVDARWAWQFTSDAELALTVQNLFDPRHAEVGAAPGRSEIQRSAYLGVRWGF
jgi:iron complex outermembrane receptor protein